MAEAAPSQTPAGAPASVDEIVLEYTLTEQDLAAFWSFCEFNRPRPRLVRRRRRRRTARRAVYAVVMLAFLAGIDVFPWVVPYLLHRAGLWSTLRYAWMVVVGGLLIVGVPLSLVWLFNAFTVFTAPGEPRHARRMLPRARAALAQLPHLSFRVIANATGIRTEHPGKEPECTPWREYAAIHNAPAAIVSLARDGRTGFVPKRALGAGEEGAARTRRILEWARAAGGGQAGAGAALGAEPCAACGYDLTGVESAVCPECGAPIEPDLWMLEKADQQAAAGAGGEAGAAPHSGQGRGAETPVSST